MKYDYDVIIVGSGVAGAICAWKLSTLGDYRILILEAGDNGIGEGQRLEFHHAMDRRGNRGDMFAPYMELDTRAFAPSPENATKPLPKPGEVSDEKYFDYTPASQDTFRAGYNRLVGGSTWAWRGNCPRFLPVDFKMQTTYGKGRDWPISYDDLEKFYCEAERELGVSGNHTELDGLFGAYRSHEFPMPGLPLTYSDTLIKPLINRKKLNGTTIRVTTTPQARNSQAYDGRPACEGHSNCIPLCPIHAKYDATVHLRRALKNPGVTLKSAAVVTQVSANKQGQITRVHFKDWRGDRTKDHIVSAPVVVLAAHAIETPKILLMSKVANSSDQVGRNLSDHIQWEVAAKFPQSVYPFRGPQSITAIESFRDGKFRKDRSGFRMTIGNDGWGRAGSPAKVIDDLISKDKGAYGPHLLAKAAAEVTRMIRLSFSTEMLPRSENRVELSSNKDPLGLPRPMFTFAPDDYCIGGLKVGFDTSIQLFGMMGIKDADIEKKGVVDPVSGKLINWNTAAHIMGTCIMGSDPADSVVDQWCRTHDHDNLFIVGSSVFASAATANPTLTLAALTLRASQAIHRQLKKGGHTA